MSSAWIGEVADAQDAMENDQMHTDEVATQPATTPPVRERPVFPQQPPPPPRADRPHRTTQQWLHPRPEKIILCMLNGKLK